jgi:hypothetical protein
MGDFNVDYLNQNSFWTRVQLFLGIYRPKKSEEVVGWLFPSVRKKEDILGGKKGLTRFITEDSIDRIPLNELLNHTKNLGFENYCNKNDLEHRSFSPAQISLISRSLIKPNLRQNIVLFILKLHKDPITAMKYAQRTSRLLGVNFEETVSIMQNLGGIDDTKLRSIRYRLDVLNSKKKVEMPPLDFDEANIPVLGADVYVENNRIGDKLERKENFDPLEDYVAIFVQTHSSHRAYRDILSGKAPHYRDYKDLLKMMVEIKILKRTEYKAILNNPNSSFALELGIKNSEGRINVMNAKNLASLFPGRVYSTIGDKPLCRGEFREGLLNNTISRVKIVPGTAPIHSCFYEDRKYFRKVRKTDSAGKASIELEIYDSPEMEKAA